MVELCLKDWLSATKKFWNAAYNCRKSKLLLDIASVNTCMRPQQNRAIVSGDFPKHKYTDWFDENL